ncbi:MAG: PKD domain-containing protein [Bacteroidota bacterium]
MKNCIYIAFIIVIVFGACKKEDAINPPDDNGLPLDFVSLVAQDTIIDINGYTNIKATATGDGLYYTWSFLAGAIIGSGSDVQYTVCHAGKFKVTCEVADANSNKLTKDVYIQAK